MMDKRMRDEIIGCLVDFTVGYAARRAAGMTHGAALRQLTSKLAQNPPVEREVWKPAVRIPRGTPAGVARK